MARHLGLVGMFNMKTKYYIQSIHGQDRQETQRSTTYEFKFMPIS